ncbi:two-component sensor histidine kinase, partial [Mesorhizobium sp. M7A.T.Ca.TU.009.01.3.2]
MRLTTSGKWIGRKWRPRLATVVVAILIMVMALPLVGLFFFRLYENQLIRQTEAELIAQGAAIAAIYAQDVRDAGIAADKLGAPMPGPGGDSS